METVDDQLHELEREFGLPAREILDVINNRNRCKIAVRGAIAEAHLLRLLRGMHARGEIGAFEDFDIDGHPDFQVERGGRSFLVECKNVEKAASGRVTIDFQRTRNPIGRPWERFYLPDEFDVVAACLWNRTHSWDFRFAATSRLSAHSKYPDRLSNRLVVVVDEAHANWTGDLPELLDTL